MEHNDPSAHGDLPHDPDATEIVAVDVEAMLHAELDAERSLLSAQMRAAKARVPMVRPAAGRPPKESIATIRAMRAAPRASSRISAAMPAASARSPMRRPPIHTLLPPPQIDPLYRDDGDDSDAAATRVFDRSSGRASVPRASVRSSVPSVKSVAFPPPSFSTPVAPQPFNTVPQIPVAKRVSADPAGESGATPIVPILAPTSRRDIFVGKAFDSYAPMAMSAYPSYAPPAAKKLTPGFMFAIVFTMIFTLGSVGVMGVGVFKPAALERGRVAVLGAMTGKQQQKAAASEAPPAAIEPPPVMPAIVPPVLLVDDAKDAGAK